MKHLLKTLLIYSAINFASLAAGALCFYAFAADLSVKAQATVPPYTSVCTVAMCTGFYVGGHVEGAGSNADILGSGLSNSLFANGAGLGAHAGYQLWNGNFFAAAEVGGTYYTGTSSLIGTAAGIEQRWSVDYLGKFGIGLQGLFGGSAATPSQGPVSIFQNLQAALVSPYVIVGGRTRGKFNGLATGAGAEYTLGGGWNAYAEYLHVNYNDTVMPGVVLDTENLVRAGVNRKF